MTGATDPEAATGTEAGEDPGTDREASEFARTREDEAGREL